AIENVRLFKELEARNRDLTATAEILQVISRSPTDVQPVLETVVENAVRLCGAERAFIFRFDGELLRAAASYNTSPELRAFIERNPISPGRQTATGRVAMERRTVHIPDVQADPEYAWSVTEVEPLRTLLGVPMLKGAELVGVIITQKREVAPFTEKQIALVETFADQAVIAIENVRLFNETKEALERQTATAEILQVISSSPTDIQPVFESIAESAMELCDAQFSAVFRFDGKLLHFAAHSGWSPAGVDALRREFPIVPHRRSAGGRAILSGAVVHIPDVYADAEYALGAVGDILRSTVAVPMLREGVAIGTINVARFEPGPFSVRQIELLKTFSDQAVIAIENVRLFKELET